MKNVSQKEMEQVIEEIRRELPRKKIAPKNLTQFTNSAYDRETLKNIQEGRGSGDYENKTFSYMKALSLFASKLELKNILELGNYAGAATVCLYDGMDEDAKLTTVDIVKDQRYCTSEMREDKRIQFVTGDACNLGIYRTVPYDIDLLFEDTTHVYRHLKDLFSIYEPLLADTALLAIDDIEENDQLKFFEESPFAKWNLTDLHFHGFALILVQRVEQLTREQRLLRAHKAAMEVWVRKWNDQHALLRARRPFKQRFLHQHKNLHQFILTVKKKLGVMSKNAYPMDEARFYSEGWWTEKEHLITVNRKKM